MQIHDYASTIPGITHGSEGEGKGRHIVIKRIGSKKEETKSAEEIKKDEISEDAEGKTELVKEMKKGEDEEAKTVDKKDDDEEELTEDAKEDKEKPQKKKVQQKKQQQQQASKNKKKGAKGSSPTAKSQAKKQQQQQQKPKPKPVSTEGLDEIDAALVELGIDTDTEHCAYRDPKTKKRCTQKVTLIYTTCKYCDKKFCFAHVQAEIHGCGATAKRQARAQVKQQYNELTKYKKMAEKKMIL